MKQNYIIKEKAKYQQNSRHSFIGIKQEIKWGLRGSFSVWAMLICALDL